MSSSRPLSASRTVFRRPAHLPREAAHLQHTLTALVQEHLSAWLTVVEIDVPTLAAIGRLYESFDRNLTRSLDDIYQSDPAMRQYAWTDPTEVGRYVRANEARLSGLSRREALKNISFPRNGAGSGRGM